MNQKNEVRPTPAEKLKAERVQDTPTKALDRLKAERVQSTLLQVAVSRRKDANGLATDEPSSVTVVGQRRLRSANGSSTVDFVVKLD